MWSHYLYLGLLRLKRNPLLTALMVLTIALGIAASMSTLTVLYVMSGNPIPEKSERLIVPLLDNGQLEDYIEGGNIPFQIGYLDAQNFLRDKPAAKQTAIYGIHGVVESERKDLPGFSTFGLGFSNDFFAMFEVPFLHGSAWSAADDAQGAYVAVISRPFSEKVFGEENPVGKNFIFQGQSYAVSGVLDHWKPLPRYYRLIAGSSTFGEIEDVMIPFNTAVKQEFSNIGDTSCNGPSTGDGFSGFLLSECTWIQFWFELASANERPALENYLQNYISEQKKLGRFARPIRYETFDVMQWLDERGVVGDDSKIQTLLALGFLLVCLVNAVGLMLAKYTARAGEIGVRRALGASQKDIFKQFMIEASVVGIAGGLLGLALSYGGLALISQQSASMKTVAHMNTEMLIATLLLAVVATILAAALPTWRACQIKPAIQLKSQ